MGRTVSYGTRTHQCDPDASRHPLQREEANEIRAWPKYTHFVADERYAEIARILGLPARTTEEGVNSLIGAIRELNSKLGIEESFQRLGIDPKDFEKNVEHLADRAFEDQCTTSNPKSPLVTELAEVYRNAFYGRF